MPKVTCSLCDSPVDGRSLRSPQKLENRIIDLIKADRPEWEGKRGICPNCLEQYRAKKFVGYLEAEYRKLSEIEHSVVSKITRRGRVSGVVHKDFDANMTFGQRVADRVARFGGSWPFIGIFGGILLVWMVVNSWVLATHPFDPYPFILLNLLLSFQAAYTAPIIMMSQNRQGEIDRKRAIDDFDINCKAEVEIETLHAKIDMMREQEIAQLTAAVDRLTRILEQRG